MTRAYGGGQVSGCSKTDILAARHVIQAKKMASVTMIMFLLLQKKKSQSRHRFVTFFFLLLLSVIDTSLVLSTCNGSHYSPVSPSPFNPGFLKSNMAY